MTQFQIKEKIRKIETELQVLKRSVAVEPDLNIDEKNWRKIRSAVKGIRRLNYQKNYGS